MTPRQREAYDFIAKFWHKKGYAPSYREIQDALAIKSVSGVHRLITLMVAQHHVAVTKGRKRSVIALEIKQRRGVTLNPTSPG